MQQFKPVSELTYSQALAELEQILQAMQSDRCDIDSLAGYTRRAAELLTDCRRRLTLTEQELDTIIQSLQSQQ